MIIKLLKSFVKNILPFGVIIYLKKKKLNRQSLESFLSEGSCKNPLGKEESKTENFKYIVSVQGFGYSGSGAVIDILRELNCATVFGGVDQGCSGAKTNRQTSFEVDIFRLSGGFFEIEKLLDSKNIFINDATIKRFIALVNSNLCQHYSKQNVFYNEIFKQAIVEFLNFIIDFSLNDLSREYYNLHIENPVGISFNNHKNIYFLKSLSKEEYREKVRKFFRKISSDLPSKHLLVLDQFLADIENDIERNIAYFPHLKTIFVYRDPRDVYIYAKEKFIEWIPTVTPEIYIKWYQKMLENFPIRHPSVLNLRFEDIVLNYDKTLQGIYHFLEVSPAQHEYAKQIFNPEVSKQNIGIWKNYPEFYKDFKTIETTLGYWCFNN